MGEEGVRQVFAVGCGLGFFSLGLALAVRAAAWRRSPLRIRLLALAAFGLLQAASVWLTLPGVLRLAFDNAISPALAALSFLALLHFAAGCEGWRARGAVAAAIAGGAGWLAVATMARDPATLGLVTGLALGLPAAGAAALALRFDGPLRADRRRLRLAHHIAAIGFAAFALLQALPVFPAPATWVDATTGNGLAPLTALVAWVLAGAMLALLGELDAAGGAGRLSRSAGAPGPVSASEARLRAIFDSEPECVKVVDADCRLVDMNRAGLDLVGAASIDQVRGRRVLDLVVPECRETYAAGVAAVFGGQSVNQSFDMISLDGTRRTMEQFAVPLMDPAAPGRVHEMLAVTRDITARIRAEQALRDAAQRLEQAQRVGDMGSWTTDYRTGELIWSDQISRIFGLTPGTFVPSYERFIESVHPEDRDLVRAAVRRSKEDGLPYDLEHRVVRPDGAIRIVRERGEVECAPDGSLRRMIGTVQDITAMRIAEKAVRRGEAVLSGILTISPEGVIVTDAERRILLFSAGAEAIFGYRAEEVVGQPVECLMPERFRSAHPGQVAGFARSAAVSRRMGERAEVAGRRKSGEEFPAEASLSKLETPDGMIFTTIMRDVTAQKQAQAELLAAKERAEAANQAKSMFIANMSHELRTPLNAIIGFSAMLMEEARFSVAPERRHEYAADIHHSGQHLLKLINDILDISRIDTGKMQIAEAPVAIDDLVESSLRMVRHRAAEAGIALEVQIAAGLPDLLADGRVLAQALINLLSNAVKFTDRGGRVFLIARGDSEAGVEIEVRDTGIGMSEADLRRVGQPFVQVEGGLARRYEGTGLGLAIARRMAELHGGSLTIQSRLGQGTAVTIRLPAGRALERRRQAVGV